MDCRLERYTRRATRQSWPPGTTAERHSNSPAGQVSRHGPRPPVRALLIVEPAATLAGEIGQRYGSEGTEIRTAGSLREAARVLRDRAFRPPVVISAMQLPDGHALDLVDGLGTGEGEWIFLTDDLGDAEARRALALGAFAALQKPPHFPYLDLLVASAARSAGARHGEVQGRHDPADPAAGAVRMEPGGRWLRIDLGGGLGLEDIDRAVIESVLAQQGHNVAAAARALNTTRDTLRYRIRKYGISMDE